MKKRNKSINLFTFIFLIMSFLFAPFNLVMADETASGKTVSESDKDADKKKKGEGEGEGEEEPDCE